MSCPLETLVDDVLAASGSTRADLAAELGVDGVELDDVLACRRPLLLDDALILADVLGISMDELGEAALASSSLASMPRRHWTADIRRMRRPR